MDSKKTIRTLVAMAVMFLILIGVIAYMNRDAVMGKLGLGPDGQDAAEQTAPDDAAQSGAEGQIGEDLSAFLRDETFFDPEVKFQSIETFAGKRVYMVMSSVAKDLRIMIVDSVGKLVTGAPFTVTVQNVGEFTDGNEDGIIYIDGLRAGEYSVMLEELEGYVVPDTITSIQVRQEIEYRVLDDIEYMILTEDQVDAAKEDTFVHSAEETADGSEDTDADTSDGAKIGIDVSKWNEEIDWERVSDEGISYAIIRCGYRGSSTGSLILDPMFEQNIQGAIAAGIPVGVYFYSQAVNEIEAVEEASMVISLIRQYDVDYPVFLDSESAGGDGRADGLEAETRTACCKAFLQTVDSAGYEAGIYASKNWLNNRLNMTQLSQYKVWLAEYADVPSYDGYYDMWQYTSKGTVDGIGTRVDLSRCYMNIDTSVDHSNSVEGYSGIVNGDSGNVPVDQDDGGDD